LNVQYVNMPGPGQSRNSCKKFIRASKENPLKSGGCL
jgi:hypothetical protein